MSAATNAAVAPVFDGRNARRIVPTRAALGADVLGIDPANPTDADIALVKETIRDHIVVRLRGYTISDPEFSRFAARFGAKQTAIPFRHATHGLHINRGILAERAGAFPPPPPSRTRWPWPRSSPSLATAPASTASSSTWRTPRPRSTGCAASVATSSPPTIRSSSISPRRSAP